MCIRDRLNFNGTNVPSGVTSTNIYITAYRYVGAKGVVQDNVTTQLSDIELDIDGITEKLISLDQRIEQFVGINTLLLKLEDDTPETPVSYDTFTDRLSDGSTTIFQVGLDTERNVYTQRVFLNRLFDFLGVISSNLISIT